MKNPYVPEYTRGLPRFHPAGATFFVTCRLHGSLPKEFLTKIHHKYEAQTKLIEQINPPDKERQLYLLHRAWFNEYEEALHRCKDGSHWLNKPEIAQLLVEQFRRYDGKWYRLEAYTILSNHFHVLLDFSIQLRPDGSVDTTTYVNLDKVIGLIKGASSFYANKKLGRSGHPFWQDGSHDRYIRGAKHYVAAVNYIKQNPVVARLCLHWREHAFTWVR
jgi:hypothetical protein